MAICRTWRCLGSRSASHGLPPPARRDLTSQNTSVRASRTMRSISPKRVRWLRATSS